MPDMPGTECACRLRRILPGLAVVFVGAVADADTLQQAVEAGGRGYLVKPFTAAQCLATLRFALWRHPGLAPVGGNGGPLPVRGLNPAFPSLSAREWDVLRWLSDGLLYKEIEARLNASGALVKKIQHRLYRKLNVCNRTEAINRWREYQRQFDGGASCVPNVGSR